MSGPYGLDGAIRLDTDQLVTILGALHQGTPGREVLQVELDRRRALGMVRTARFTGKHSIGEHLPGEAIPDPIQHQLGICPACGKSETVVNYEADRFTCVNLDRGPGRAVLGCGAMWRGARTGTPA